jgi:3-hydroxyisobutyrate dehydrogenase-like beta-hydroxyacid dehydrogenase
MTAQSTPDRQAAPARPRVAVLGTGKMGTAIARRLAAEGFEVTVWNRTRSRAEAVGVGRVADTPREAVAASDVVLSILTGPEAVREVHEGPGGAAEAADGRLFAEMSTAGPEAALEVARIVEQRGGRVVEAPVAGSVPAIEQGKLLIMAGGEAADIERARPVLEVLGEIRHIGPLGFGNRLKLVYNSMLAIISAAAAELQAAGVAAGLSPEHTFFALARQAPYLELRRAGYIEGRYEPVMFSLKDMLKDVRLGLDLYRQVGADVPITELTEQVYAEVAPEHGDEELSAINERYRKHPVTSRG